MNQRDALQSEPVPVRSARARWQLMGDPAAEKRFSGPDCELCKPPSKWTVLKKMMQ